MSRLVLAFSLLLTSHLFAWQPSGWVYQMGDYQYEYESGDWYWKMNWDFWHVNPSIEDWNKDSANGWNYYTYPYFYSTSMGQWRFASDPGSGADIVNLSTGSWSKFGKETQTAFAPSAIEPGTVVETSSSIVFVLNNNDYAEFYKDGLQFTIGEFYYTQTAPNSARLLSVSTAGYLAYYGSIVGNSNATDVTFNTKNYFTTSEGGAGSIEEPQDYAPTTLSGREVYINGYSFNTYTRTTATGTGNIIFNNANSGTYYSTRYTSINYNYAKIGPREGRINATGIDLNYGTFNASFAINFLTESTGYYLSTITYSNGISEVSWGTFTME